MHCKFKLQCQTMLVSLNSLSGICWFDRPVAFMHFLWKSSKDGKKQVLTIKLKSISHQIPSKLLQLFFRSKQHKHCLHLLLDSSWKHSGLQKLHHCDFTSVHHVLHLLASDTPVTCITTGFFLARHYQPSGSRGAVDEQIWRRIPGASQWEDLGLRVVLSPAKRLQALPGWCFGGFLQLPGGRSKQTPNTDRSDWFSQGNTCLVQINSWVEGINNLMRSHVVWNRTGKYGHSGKEYCTLSPAVTFILLLQWIRRLFPFLQMLQYVLVFLYTVCTLLGYKWPNKGWQM